MIQIDVKVYTYFLFLKIKFRVRQTMAKMIPTVASREKITVRGTATVTISSIGTPS